MNYSTVKSGRSGFNHVESFYEIEITPNELRQISAEIERVEDTVTLPGQVIRFKLASGFALTYRPEKKRTTHYETAREVNPPGFVPSIEDGIIEKGIET